MRTKYFNDKLTGMTI